MNPKSKRSQWSLDSGAPWLAATTSWDDGHPLDHRMSDLLDRYGVRGTFFVAPRNVEFDASGRLDDSALRDLAARADIGGHTLNHLRLTKLDDVSAQAEIRDGKEYLEQVIGRRVRTFCYPGGCVGPGHPELVRAAGFESARTVERFVLNERHDLMRLGTTMNCYRHLVDGPWLLRYTRGEMARAVRYFWNWDELAIALFEHKLRTGGIYHLWGHSWEVDVNGDWGRLERVLAHISGREEVAYVDNSELLEWLT